MPSPLGHALGGAIVGLALVKPKPHQTDPANLTNQTDQTDRTYRAYLTDLTWCVFAACLPDIDFLWGRHGMETHSIGVAIVAGAVVFAASRRPNLAIACALAWMSHILFDWLGSDDFPPIGIMALWPFTNDFYFAHAYLFDTITRRYRLPGFWQHNIGAVIKEVILLAPIVLALAWWRFSRRRS